MFPNELKRVQQEGLKEVLLLEKEELEPRSPASLRQVTEMVLQPGDTGPRQ